MPSDDERTLAALAHASIILNVVSLGGIVAAAVIWATQRRHSRFVAQHALQALLFQGLGLALMLLGSMVWGGCLLLGLLPVVMRPDLYHSGPPAVFWVVLVAGLLLVGFVLSGLLYAAIAAVQAWRGQLFRYALVGQFVDRQFGTFQEVKSSPTNADLQQGPGNDPAVNNQPILSPVGHSIISVPPPSPDVERPAQPVQVQSADDSTHPPT